MVPVSYLAALAILSATPKYDNCHQVGDIVVVDRKTAKGGDMVYDTEFHWGEHFDPSYCRKGLLPGTAEHRTLVDFFIPNPKLFYTPKKNAF